MGKCQVSKNILQEIIATRCSYWHGSTAIGLISSNDAAERSGIDVMADEEAIALAMAKDSDITDSSLQPVESLDQIKPIAAQNRLTVRVTTAHQGTYWQTNKAGSFN